MAFSPDAYPLAFPRVLYYTYIYVRERGARTLVHERGEKGVARGAVREGR